MRLVEVVVRQAHPGPGAPPYRSAGDKLADARRYRDAEQIPWPVLADELDGRVHLAYGGLAAPTYLVDAEGRVAFQLLWPHAPTLHRAIEALLWQGGRGVVLGGRDRRPHLLPALAGGWRGPRRARPGRAIDLVTAAPVLAVALSIGRLLRPVLAPLALRARPLPTSARVALALGGTGLALLAAAAAMSAPRRPSPRPVR